MRSMPAGMHNERLVTTPTCLVGRFTWEAPVGSIRDSVIGERAVMVLPAKAVRIEQHGRGRFLADSRTAVLYPAGLHYRATQVETNREASVFIGIDPALAAETPCCLPTPESTVLRRERLLALLSDAAPDLLRVEEAIAVIVHEVIHRRRHTATPALRLHRHHEEAHQIRERLLGEFTQAVSLASLAEGCGISAYNAARAFRHAFGISIHQYRLNLRLRASVHELAETAEPLVEIALKLGFSSQSHLTAAFSRNFGVSPAKFRRELRSCNSSVAGKLWRRV